MQLDQAWRLAQGADAPLLHAIDVSFASSKPEKIAVAVSGGGDSLALLHLFLRWAAQTGHMLSAVTVDHTLRAESADEALQVAAFCEIHGVPHQTLRWDNWDGHGNIQAAARDARYQLISDWAKSEDIGGVALGHTKDDVAETYLMRMARKAGIDGLSHMARDFDKADLRWCRPLLHHTRSELRDYLKRHDLQWIDDPSNDDVRFERVRVRAALETLGDIGLTADALVHAAHVARDAQNALEHYALQEAETHVSVDRGDVIMPYAPQPAVPGEVARRLRTKIVQWIGGLPYPPRLKAMQGLSESLALAGNHTVGGCLVTRSGNTLRFSRELNAVRSHVTKTDQIWDNRWRLDGPHADDLHTTALGDGILECENWRDTGLPRTSLMASPAVWRGETLIAAPLAGYNDQWTAQIVADFVSSMLTH